MKFNKLFIFILLILSLFTSCGMKEDNIKLISFNANIFININEQYEADSKVPVENSNIIHLDTNYNYWIGIDLNYSDYLNNRNENLENVNLSIKYDSSVLKIEKISPSLCFHDYCFKITILKNEFYSPITIEINSFFKNIIIDNFGNWSKEIFEQ